MGNNGKKWWIKHSGKWGIVLMYCRNIVERLVGSAKSNGLSISVVYAITRDMVESGLDVFAVHMEEVGRREKHGGKVV